MGKIGIYLWTAFFITLLGWYGWAMFGIGLVLMLIGGIIMEKYVDYKYVKKYRKLEKMRRKRWE